MAGGLYAPRAGSGRTVVGLRYGFAVVRWRANPGTPKTVWITPAAVAPAVVGPERAKSEGATKASEAGPGSVGWAGGGWGTGKKAAALVRTRATASFWAAVRWKTCDPET